MKTRRSAVIKNFKSLVVIVFFLSSGWVVAQDGVLPSDGVAAEETLGGYQGEPSSELDALELRDMDINDVLKLLAAKSGLNIIAGKTVQGRVTIFLQHVQVRDALTIILKANDLAFIEDKGVIQIVSAAEYEQLMGHKFGVITQSEVFHLQSVKAADAAAILTQMKSVNGKIITDDQSNSVMVDEIPEKLVAMRAFIKTVDVATVANVYKLQNIPAEAISAKLQEMITPKIGSLKVDTATNKIFIKDTVKKSTEIEAFIKQVDEPRESKIFEINYAKAEDIAKTLQTLTTKDLGSVQFDARSNTVVVTDIAPKIKEISTVIKALDKEEKQVLIEARIIQVILTDEYKMGIDWDKIIPNSDHPVVSLSNKFGLGTLSTGSMATVGTLDRDQYRVALQMIASLGNTQILSNPRVAVVNNQEARILVGKTTPYVTSATIQSASGPTTTADSVNFIDTGIKLHVTPFIHDDGYITMKIKPEVSNSPSTIKVGPDKNEIPVVDTSEVETTIRVKDGVTIIIGGLIKDEYKNNKGKIPVLGDIPLLGKAFRSEERSVLKTEIIIFLTPRIITGDVAAEEPANFPMLKGHKTSAVYYNPLPKDDSIPPLP